MNEPSVDFRYPDEVGQIDQNHYREACLKALGVLNISLAYIYDAKNKNAAVAAVSYALGLATCDGLSITDKSQQLGISPQALSKYIKEVEELLNINTSSYTYGNSKKRY